LENVLGKFRKFGPWAVTKLHVIQLHNSITNYNCIL